MSGPAASIPHRFIRASAGTGKTYALVAHYLELITTHRLEPRDIVVITFTVRAAAELRQRIRAALAQMDAPPALMAQLSTAPITNFHGLCLGPLAEALGHSHAIEKPLNILGESGEEALFMAAAEQAWFSGDPKMHEAVVAVAPHVALDGQGIRAMWMMLSRMREDGACLSLPNLGTYAPKQVLARYHTLLLELRGRLVASDPKLLGSATAVEQLKAFAAAPVPDASLEALPAWRAGWLSALGCLKRTSNVKRIYSANDRDNALAWVLRPEAEWLCARLAEPLAALIEAAFTRYTQRKKELQSRDFVDVIADCTAKMQHDPTSHRRVRQRFAAVLVDEAQDTNGLQRTLVELLVGLCGPAAANLSGAPAAAHLAVVGDAKQSIYQFRGADVENFGRLESVVLEGGGQSETLCVSRRSSAAMVAGINDVGRFALQADYEPLVALDEQAETSHAAVTWLTSPADGDVAQRTRDEAQVVANHVAARLAAGKKASALGVLLPFGKFAAPFVAALRARGIAASAQLSSELLTQPHIRDLLALLAWLDTPTRLLDAAVALRSPFFALSDAALVMLLGPEGRAAHRLGQLCRGELIDHPDPLVAWASARYAGLRAQLDELSLADMLVAVEAELDLITLWRANPLSAQPCANFEQLFALAAEADRKGCGRLLSFVEQLRHHDAQGLRYREGWQSQTDEDAVSVLSMHASKGLEFDEVIIANIARQPRTSSDTFCYARSVGAAFFPRHQGMRWSCERAEKAHQSLLESEQAERARLLYVAVSRAKERLVLVGQEPKKMARGAWGQLLASWAQQPGSEPRLSLVAGDASPAAVEGAPPIEDVSHEQNLVVASPKKMPRTRAPRVRLTATALAEQLATDGGFPSPETPSTAASLEAREQPLPLGLSRRAQGELRHRVLRYLTALPSDADDTAIGDFVYRSVARAGHDARDAAIRPLCDDLIRFLRGPLGQALRQIPAAQRLEELPFRLCHAHRDAEIEVAGQVDLVLYSPERPSIIDYKASRGRDGDASYRAQLMVYAWALSRQLPWADDVIVEGRLIYLDGADPLNLVIDAKMRQKVVACLDAMAVRIAADAA